MLSDQDIVKLKRKLFRLVVLIKSRKIMMILKKSLLVLIVLGIIYFSLGFIASIVFIVMESFTHQMSSEIGNDFSPWIIYVCMILLAIVFGLIVMGLGIGFYHLRKNIRNS